MITDIEVDSFLEHHGVKGMKWGQRRAARQRNRQLNKESRKRDWAKQQKEVERARARVASGQTKRDFKAAKAQYKQNKIDLGSREAKKLLNKARNKKYAEIDKSHEVSTKKEAAAVIAGLAGITLVRAFAASR